MNTTIQDTSQEIQTPVICRHVQFSRTKSSENSEKNLRHPKGEEIDATTPKGLQHILSNIGVIHPTVFVPMKGLHSMCPYVTHPLPPLAPSGITFKPIGICTTTIGLKVSKTNKVSRNTKLIRTMTIIWQILWIFCLKTKVETHMPSCRIMTNFHKQY